MWFNVNLDDPYADLRNQLLVPTGQMRYLRTVNQLGHSIVVAIEATAIQYDHDGVPVCSWWTALEGDGWLTEPGDQLTVRDESCLVPLVRVNQSQQINGGTIDV